jgi:ABC-2 type transport system permease protein
VIVLIAAEVAKVRTTRLWIGLLLGAVALAALGAIATLAIAGTPDGREAGLTPIETVDDVRDFVTTGAIAGVFALVLGATTMTTEHRHRTLSSTFLATPTRWPVVGAKVACSALAGFVFGVVGALVPFVAAAVEFALDGEAIPFGPPVALAIVAVGAGAAFSAALGATAGAALRSQLIAILAVLGWALVVESLVGAIVPAAVKWFPFTGLTNSLTQAGDGPDLFSPPIAGLLMALYLAIATTVGIAVTMRRDVE